WRPGWSPCTLRDLEIGVVDLLVRAYSLILIGTLIHPLNRVHLNREPRVRGTREIGRHRGYAAAMIRPRRRNRPGIPQRQQLGIAHGFLRTQTVEGPSITDASAPHRRTATRRALARFDSCVHLRTGPFCRSDF